MNGSSSPELGSAPYRRVFAVRPGDALFMNGTQIIRLGVLSVRGTAQGGSYCLVSRAVCWTYQLPR